MDNQAWASETKLRLYRIKKKDADEKSCVFLNKKDAKKKLNPLSVFFIKNDQMCRGGSKDRHI